MKKTRKQPAFSKLPLISSLLHFIETFKDKGLKMYTLGIMLSELISNYYDHKVRNSCSKNYALQITKMAKHVLRFSNDIPIKQIDKDFVSSFILYLKKYKRSNGLPLSPNSSLTYFKNFNSMLNFAVQKEFIVENPIRKLSNDERLKSLDSLRCFLCIDEIKKLIRTPCKREDVKNAFLFSCFCGLRLSDIRALKSCNIVTINGKRRLNLIVRKTKRQIEIPLNEQALSFLPKERKLNSEDFVFNIPSNQYVGKILIGWATSAGIQKHITFHVSRHTFATMALTAGADIYTISKLLGHSNFKTTQIYTKVVDRKKEEAINLMSKLFSED